MKSVHEFSTEVLDAIKKFDFIKSVSAGIQDGIIFRCRLFIESDFFIDVFYNSRTSKTAFTLIKNEKRIYGVDNTGGWHRHPFEDPRSHVTSKEISISRFLKEIELYIGG